MTPALTTASSASFRVGLIQLRSGRTPRANIDAAVRLIGEARDAGADYVQTPEMTNIMEVKREEMFAAIAPEESDPGLAAFRETARARRLWVHVGSLALKVSPDKAANCSISALVTSRSFDLSVSPNSKSLKGMRNGCRPGSRSRLPRTQRPVIAVSVSGEPCTALRCM